ncbi:plasmid replication protein, CyRepA1 family, partial [Cyanobium sp. Lug-B]|uniref:plasmid replication protein, CyRepA1 family n=1 Tax=Cyanobium sp. Lug-B TaxID=2823716 RepID=UPI0020CB8607
AERIAARYRLEPPVAVLIDLDGGAGAFWRWWASEPRLPLVVVEGAKKAAALLSAGVPAVALPGIWNGAPKGPDGRPALLSDLAAVPLAGRAVWILFDHSSRPDPAEPKAARRLARLLLRAGAREALIGTVPGTHGKGPDDHLANGGTWEQLAAVLAPPAPLPVLPRLRAADIVAPAGSYLGDVAPIPAPSEARLVAISGAMGSGKTEAIAAAVAPLLATGVRVVLLTHRRSLGAALADRLGLPWGDDALPGSDLRQQGIALCIDSLVGRSAVRFNPADWAGAVVVIDEAAQLLAHALFTTGTAIAHRRPEALANLSQLLAGAAQVIAADAQLSEPVLEALKTATGSPVLLIGSDHRPAVGRELVAHPSRASWRRELVAQLRRRRRLWIATTAKDGPNGAKNLAELTAKHWPGVPVLVVDSKTVADPNHDAYRLASDPNGIAARYPVVIATPAVAAGLSVTLRGHFEAVLVMAGGTTDPEAVAQAAARVRDDCPRHLFAPDRSPGDELRVGSGSFEAQQLLTHQAQHGAAIAAQLAGTVDLAAGTIGPWLPLWAQLAAATNRKALAYGSTVRALLEREGYRVIEAGALSPEAEAEAQQIAAELEQIAAAAQAADDAAVIAAEPLTAAEARELERKRKQSPAEAARLARYRVAEAWGLGAAPPTPELLEAHRNRQHRRHRFGWILQNLEARPLVARHDQAIAASLASGRRSWAPDLCRETIGPKVTAADAMGVLTWLNRRDWFTAEDPELLALQALATAHGGSLRQVLGVSPGKRATTTLRALLALAGYRLEAKRSREGDGRAWRYRVVPEPLPAGVTPEQLPAAWAASLSQKSPY